MLTYVDESRFLAGWYGYSLRSKRGGMDIPCILMNKNDLPYRRDRDSLDFLYPRASQTCPRAVSGWPSGKENPGCPSLFYKVYTILLLLLLLYTVTIGALRTSSPTQLVISIHVYTNIVATTAVSTIYNCPLLRG